MQVMANIDSQVCDYFNPNNTICIKMRAINKQVLYHYIVKYSKEGENHVENIVIGHRVYLNNLALYNSYISFHSFEFIYSGCLPSFAVAGFHKSGTSSMKKYLTLHPDIYPTIKETHFYDFEKDTIIGPANLRNDSYRLLQYVFIEKLSGLDRWV